CCEFTEKLSKLSLNKDLATEAQILVSECIDQLLNMLDIIAADQDVTEADELKSKISFLFIKVAEAVKEDEEENITDLSMEEAEEEAEEKITRFIPVDLDEDGEEILGIFMEEAHEIIISLDETIAQWKADTGNKEYVALMQRNLHTLKGGARLSELNLLGDLSHHLETIYEGVVEGRRAVDATLLQLSLDARDVIYVLINEIDEHRRMTPPQEFIALLEKETNKIIVINYPEVEVDSTEKTEEAIAVVGKTSKEEMITEHDLDLPPLDQAIQFVPVVSQQPVPVVKKKAAKAKNTGEQVKVGAETLEDLVNLAGESSILRSRMEQQVNTLRYNLDEMNSTIDRLRSQLRAMEIETDAQIQYRQEAVEHNAKEFDPLEMDRYSRQQELSRGLSESSNDLLNLKDNFDHLTVETEALLLQQGRINTELQERLIDTRMIPFDSLVPRLQRMGRQIGKELDKAVEISIHADGEMDRTVLEKMISPIEHMLRNAIDHGIESPDVRAKQNKEKKGRIKIRLTREGAQVVISISDDGAGIDLEAVREKALEREIISSAKELSDKELIKLIFSAGFSTAEKVTQISGRGVGMDVVFNQIKKLGGYVDVESAVGEGSQFIVRLPFTVSVNNALMVTVKDELYALPFTNIEGIVTVSPYELEELYKLDEPVYEYAGVSYELYYLGTLLEHEKNANFEGVIKSVPVILLHGVDRPIAVQLDGLIGSREVVVKSIGAQLSSIGGLSGATILGDGSVVLILDIHSLWRRLLASDGEKLVETETLYEGDYIPTVMVVDDSITVRKVTSRLLERNHFNVITAKDGVDAVSQLHEVHPDIILLDIEMPKMDGFELASIVRSEPDLKDIPIIMITTRTGVKHKERAMNIGINDYMGKPYGEAKLLSSISKLIDLDGKD
ncbi:MAG: hybrid sensor histidine kinase/response regulator, partial [Gammaproteobacteria bacterium]|nr:hybrid sensor histidine kinase/response regulator [Gammaproteobacteria bacterium]